MHCGGEYEQGDCIGMACPKCLNEGHEGFSSDCLKCKEIEIKLEKQLTPEKEGERLMRESFTGGFNLNTKTKPDLEQQEKGIIK